ncbi:OmpP1/FadL family transporter [Gaoshiqia sp. Z1-71]|uniref:OmpP1/FadL family transporter n=1 Tax=Gaoshiqia hydrogeniformans TaxID=3290090 RepID=UPI003BF7C368
MKKIELAFFLCLLSVSFSYAGGILTNANQSAQYVRMLSRNASTQADAVYFNPAGLVNLENGFHFSLNNQSIFQSRTIENNFPLLNQSTYEGGLTVPVFPSAFAVYKKDKLALSFGFGVNGGGGTAEYKTGLPSFEIPFSTLPTVISGFGIPTSNYSADLFFKGSSVFLGFQLGVSYEISDVVSGSVGLRYIDAVNNYDGHIHNILINPQHPQINPNGSFMPATDFFTAIGQPGYAVLTADKDVDVKQTGKGLIPILGLNIKPGEKLNIGMRYEFRTKLEMTNETKVDGTGQFPDDAKFRNDIPAILAAGVDYQLFDNMKVSASYSNYFDKDANWDGKEENVDKNLYELAFGMEYQISETTTISAGYMYTKTGVGRGFQSDISFSLTGNSVGMGLMFKVNERTDLDLGVLYTAYASNYKESNYSGIPYKESYDKTNLVFSIGLTYHLFK